MSIADNISTIRKTLPSEVNLVCVSKYHTEHEILEAYAVGERHFGESRAQELERKALSLPTDIHWHFIGHLQRNKVKQVCRFASMIQSVDSERLLFCIDQMANKPIDILLEVHVAAEDTKTGLTTEQLFSLMQTIQKAPLNNVRICGLMGMATQTDNQQQILEEFRLLRKLFERIKAEYFVSDVHFNILSMGMSDDYRLALTAGTNMVRIGSRIFAQDE